MNEILLASLIGLATTSSAMAGTAIGLYCPLSKRSLACILVRLARNEFGAGDRSNRARTSLERSSGSAFDESSARSSKSPVIESVYGSSRVTGHTFSMISR